MSGLYISGMEMPKNCYECLVRNQGFSGDGMKCGITGSVLSWYDGNRKRMDNCSLLPVPEHGRLIDADAFKKRMLQGALDAREDAATEEIWLKILDAVNNLCLDVDEQPTIIPADKEV